MGLSVAQMKCKKILLWSDLFIFCEQYLYSYTLLYSFSVSFNAFLYLTQKYLQRSTFKNMIDFFQYFWEQTVTEHHWFLRQTYWWHNIKNFHYRFFSLILSFSNLNSRYQNLYFKVYTSQVSRITLAIRKTNTMSISIVIVLKHCLVMDSSHPGNPRNKLFISCWNLSSVTKLCQALSQVKEPWLSHGPTLMCLPHFLHFVLHASIVYSPCFRKTRFRIGEFSKSSHKV